MYELPDALDSCVFQPRVNNAAEQQTGKISIYTRTSLESMVSR